jgi:hypothetical protein
MNRESLGSVEFDEVSAKHLEGPTIAGMPIMIDPYMPNGLIYIRDATGKCTFFSIDLAE